MYVDCNDQMYPGRVVARKVNFGTFHMAPQPDGPAAMFALTGSRGLRTVFARSHQLTPQYPETGVTQREPTTPPRVLVVEDTALVAMLIETMIEDMGWTVVGPAAQLQDAVAAAGSEAIDAAIVDVNLNGEAAWEVAMVLRGRGVPFVFTTGYSDQTPMPPGLEAAPIMGKPFQVRDLEAWLRSVVPEPPDRGTPRGHAQTAHRRARPDGTLDGISAAPAATSGVRRPRGARP